MFQRSIIRLGTVLNHAKLSSANMSFDTHNDVIFQTVNKMAVLILNRPKALNSLNFSMMRKMIPQLKKWENDPAIGFVVMKGAGDKAFCSGGDIRELTESPEGKRFFLEEYPLDYKIGTFKKPFVSVIDGIVMGGGFGLSGHSKFRVATERTVFAMPETAIGLVPDVGGGYILPRLEGKLGMFLGLTGQRLKGRDVQLAGIATHYIESKRISDLDEAFARLDNPTETDIQQLLDVFHKESLPNAIAFILKPYMETINRTFNGDSVEEILQNLEKDGSEWALKQLKLLYKMSPTSMKLTHRQIIQGANLSLKECFEVENRLCQRCLEDKDIYEGVRAVIKDKDNNPKWTPATLAEVTQEKLDHYFSRLPENREIKMFD